MTGYALVNLNNIIRELGEDRAKSLLSNFSCPLNYDVENFIKTKAIEFAKQGIAATHLVFTSYKDAPVLIGYFTLTIKNFFISEKALTSSLRRRLRKFAQQNSELKGYNISAPLIAQLGKNFTDGYNKLITGDELLKIASDKIYDIQQSLSGKVIFLECEDCEKLMEFYISNGFQCFAKRELDKHEQANTANKYLMQLIKYVS